MGRSAWGAGRNHPLVLKLMLRRDGELVGRKRKREGRTDRSGRWVCRWKIRRQREGGCVRSRHSR